MTQQPSSSRNDLLPDRRRARRPRGLLRTRRTAVVVAALLAALAGLGLVPPTASAAVTAARAALACGYAEVRAYPPAQLFTASTLAYTRLDTRAELYRYDATTGGWTFAANSGWWPYTVTTRTGYPGVVVPGAFWATPGNRGAMYFPFAAAPGNAYMVKTWIYDDGDRTTRYVWNTVNVSNPDLGNHCHTG